MVKYRLSNDSLNLPLRIQIGGITLQDFQETYVKKCVHNSKNGHLNQQKRKNYQKPQTKKVKRPCFRVADLSSTCQIRAYQTVNILMPLTLTYNNI